MKADQLNEFNKVDWDKNESVNLHSENAVELAKEFGTPEEVEAMQRIMDQHMRRGHILPHEIEERNALTSKYYSMLEHSVNPTFKSTLEGYKVLPAMDKEKYQARDGLEGPFSTLSGKVVYYDPKEGSYYDPDTDMYMSYDEFQKYDNDYSDMKNEWVQDSPEKGFSGQERNFIEELCLRMDGVSKSPEGLRWMGKSETWDEGNVLSDKGKLTTVMLWAKKNIDDLYDKMGSEFKVYSDGNDKGDSGRGQSDGNQIIQNIINKVGKIGEETAKGPRGHLSSIVADAVNEIDCWDGYKKDGTKPGTGKNKGKRVNNCVKEEDVTVDNAGNIAGYLATIDEYVEMLFKSDGGMSKSKGTEIAYRIQNAVDDIRTRELGMKPSNIRSKFNEDEVNEEHDIGLLKAVARQMEADAHKGDYTAIEELLQDVSTEELKGFLSDHRDMDMDEGKSPHKKGTEKYKKHMAAMHAG